jgi:maltose O-acetyltransferase
VKLPDQLVLRHLINFLLGWLPPSRCFGLRAALLRICRVHVGRDAKICGRGWIYGRGSLAIGDGTWLSPQVLFYTHLDAPIRIGDRCDIGPGVQFITGSHLIGDGTRRAGPGTAKSIHVGSGCWIGAGSRILGGVSIGDGAVIAAGAVVTRDVPPHCLAAGIPAIVKRELPA